MSRFARASLVLAFLTAWLHFTPLTAAYLSSPVVASNHLAPSASIDMPTSSGQDEDGPLFQRRGRRTRPPATTIQVPILMYHYIRINPDPADQLGFNLSVTPADFAAQVAYLSSHGYHTIGLGDLASYLSGDGDPPVAGSVVFTFDDGYRDAYDAAFPVLKKYGFSATFFIITGFVGHPNYLTTSQLREMADAGMTIGAHTVNHPDLTTASPLSAQKEIAESKATLERTLSRPVPVFCYPSGRFNSSVIGLVKSAGYQAAVTVDYGLVHKPEEVYTLSRVRVSGGESVAALASSAGLVGNAPPPDYPPAAAHPFGGPSPL